MKSAAGTSREPCPASPAERQPRPDGLRRFAALPGHPALPPLRLYGLGMVEAIAVRGTGPVPLPAWLPYPRRRQTGTEVATMVEVVLTVVAFGPGC